MKALPRFAHQFVLRAELVSGGLVIEGQVFKKSRATSLGPFANSLEVSREHWIQRRPRKG